MKILPKVLFAILLISFFISTVYTQNVNDFSREEIIDMSLEELMNLSITTASKKEEKIKDIPASVVVITKRDIENYGYTSLEDILCSIPGLYNIYDYGYGQNYGVRGFWTDVPNRNIVVMVNGVKQIHNITASNEFSRINVPVEAIERIEVVRGPLSVIYGEGAFFGAINIFTYSEKKKTHIASSIGNNSTYNFFVGNSGGEGNFKYSLNAAFHSSDGIIQDFSKMGAPFPGDTKNLLDEESKYLGFWGKFNDLTVNIEYNENRNNYIFLAPGVNEGSLSNIYSTTFSVEYKPTITKNFKAELKFHYLNENFSFDWDYENYEFFGYQIDPSNSYEFELLTLYKQSESLELTAGFNFRNITDLSTLVDIPGFGMTALENAHYTLALDNSLSTKALFFQSDWMVSEDLKIVIGLRLEQGAKYDIFYEQGILENSNYTYFSEKRTYDNSKLKLIPRLAAIYSLNNNSSIKFLFGRAINNPSFFQNLEPSFNPYTPDLKSEFINTYELNYIANHNEWLNTSFSLFYNKFDNLIYRSVGFDEDGNYYTDYSNEGSMETIGSELLINVNLSKKVLFDFAFTYQHTNNLTLGNKDAAYCPAFLGYLRFAYKMGNLILSMNGNYVDKMEPAWELKDESVNLEDMKRIGNGVKSNITIGMNLRYNNFISNGLYLNLNCSNLFDEEIHYPTLSSNTWAVDGTIGKARRILFSVGYKL